MNAEPSEPVDSVSDAELNRALVVLYRLSGDAVAEIREVMDRLTLRFSEAALHTGAISREELDEAVRWVQQRAKVHHGTSVVEEALRRAVQRRDSGVYEGDKVTPSRALLIAHDSDHPRAEMIRRLRTELLLRMRNQRGGAFALLSPCAAEGRSQLAAELAISFAQLGKRTLLVDADLRRPSQHGLFGADNEMGLVQALQEDSTLHLHGVNGLPKMSVLTSGGQPPNPLELLSGPHFDRVVLESRRNFEFVIVDTPPTSEFSDGLAVATALGTALLIGRAERTTFSALREMCRHLQPTHACILGAVINKF
jgi:receptor protein-tyrosine kinase